MKKAHLRPTREGLIVVRPNGVPLKADGEEVVLSSYWARRLADGDVERYEPKRSTRAKKAKGGDTTTTSEA